MDQPVPLAEPPVSFSVGAWRAIADGVFVAMAEPEGVNFGLVVGTDAALLVDTGSSPDQGAAVRASIAGVTDRPLNFVVVTHWHYDHAFGLAAYADLPRIGHETLTARLTSPAAKQEAVRLGVDPATLLPPDRPVAVAAAVDLGNQRVEVVHLGAGHTDGDLVVVLPGANVVFAGDLVESSGPPSFGEDSAPASWAATLDGVIGLLTADSIVVPGHGDPVDREFVFAQRGQVAAEAAGQVAPARTTLPLA